MKRKVAAMTMVLAMGASLLAGCGNNAAGTGASAGGTEAGTTASSDVTGKTKLKALFVAHPLTKDVNEMKWLQEIEDEAGVDVEWEVIYSDWDNIKATRFASGDIPDLLFNATIDSDYTTYNGLFLDLTELIEKDAPNITEMFEEEPDTKTLATTMEGQIFATPKFQGKWPETNTVMFINQQWLDNLGLEAPKTFTELQTVLEAFKNEDANGNGDPSDEIPMDYNCYGTAGWFNSAYSMTNLMGAMGIQLTNWGTDAYFTEDGQVKNYAVDERYKLFMKYMNQLYSEGLLNSEAITNEYSVFQSTSRGDEAGNALVGVTFGWEETDKFGPDLYSQYVALPALDYDVDCEAGTYDTRWRDDFSGLNMSSNRVCMSAKCENQDAAMKFIDSFYDKAHSVETLFGGITDGCVEEVSENSFKVLDPQDPDTDAGTWKWTNAFADNGPMYIRQATEIEMSQDMTNALNERSVYADTLAKADETDSYPQMFMKYSAEDQNTMAVNQANITNITDNYWSLWMTGESDIDADWDAYVESVYAAGLQQNLDIRQAAFDAYLAK